MSKQIRSNILSWGQRYSTGFPSIKYSDQIIPLDEEHQGDGKSWVALSLLIWRKSMIKLIAIDLDGTPFAWG